MRANDFDSLRVPCGGKRRLDGQPCEALSVPVSGAVGGTVAVCSTGLRTVEGNARVTANLHNRR